jgi:hypothetical protein
MANVYIITKSENSESILPERQKNIEIPENIKLLSGILEGKFPENVNVWDAKYEYMKERYNL